MPKIISEFNGQAGFDFESSLPVVKLEDTKIQTVMGVDTAIFLRDIDNKLLLKIDGFKLDELHRKGRINASRPDLLHKSIFEYWKSQQKSHDDISSSFRFVVSDSEDVESLIGQTKLLLDWLTERRDMNVSIKRAKQVEKISNERPQLSPEKSDSSPDRQEVDSAPASDSVRPDYKPSSQLRGPNT